jgi:uncharacterized phage-associated protein
MPKKDYDTGTQSSEEMPSIETDRDINIVEEQRENNRSDSIESFLLNEDPDRQESDGMTDTLNTEENTAVTVNVYDVASYILHKLGDVSTMKLQKLVYYCQAWSLVWDEKPLFPESIKAWANGPVVGELFFQLKGLFTVNENHLLIGNYKKLNEVQIETIDAVIEHYGDKSAQWLITLSHMEDPWKNTRDGLQDGIRSNRIIALEDMASYYSSL